MSAPRRTVANRTWAATRLALHEQELPRLQRLENLELQRISFLRDLIGLYDRPDVQKLQKMAQGVQEQLLQELRFAPLYTDEGRMQALELQGELRAMEWFTKGQDALRKEMAARQDKRENFLVRIKELKPSADREPREKAV